MKKRDLERRMARLAKKYGVDYAIKHGSSHDKWYVGPEAMMIPRHSEVNERLAKGVLAGWESLLAEAAKEQEEGDK